MTPKQLAKSGTEHGEQSAVFAYCAAAYRHGFDVAEQWCEVGPQAFLASPYVNDVNNVAVPALQWIHAIPNGGSRGDDKQTRAIRGGQMKAEGVRKGIADIFMPWPLRTAREYDEKGDPASYTDTAYCGLYIELKREAHRPKRGGKGGVSDKQSEFGEYAKRLQYGFRVCYGWREAVDTIRSYIEWKG